MLKMNIVVEDYLSEIVLRKIIRQHGQRITVGGCFGKKGFPFIQSNLAVFNRASELTPHLILTDLDDRKCAPALIRAWFPFIKNKNLIFRIAVKEVEAWLIADRKSFSKYMGVGERVIPVKVEVIGDPKKFIIDTARRSPKMKLRDSIVPRDGAAVGPDYNSVMALFANKHWNIDAAIKNSNSLKRAVGNIKNFQSTH
jgi:hypothetical protein